jgi:hypothetical protein
MYKVTRIRTLEQIFYIDTDDYSDALDDANELDFNDYDFEIVEDHCEYDEVSSAPKYSEVWTGGPEGEWTTA